MSESKSVSCKLQLGVFLGALALLAQTYGTTYIQIGDTAGLPYPATEQDDIFLKEAHIRLHALSGWERQASGFEPHHALVINMNARYILQNDSDREQDLSIKFPLMVSADDDNSVSFALNSRMINYSSVEYANPRGEGTGLSLYALDVRIPPGSSRIEVNATSTGVAGRDADFTVIMNGAFSGRWPGPPEKVVVSSEHKNGIITGYSIPPTKTTLKQATWELDEVPDRDLTLRFRITEQPIASGMDGDDEEIGPSDPLIPPVIAIAAGGAIIGFIVYIRMKRRAERRRRTEERHAGRHSSVDH